MTNTLIGFKTNNCTPGDLKAWFRDDIGHVLGGLRAARVSQPGADPQFEAGYTAALLAVALTFGLTPIYIDRDLT